MSTLKRERSTNFNREEVELLTSLVAQRKNILENKKSDAVTWYEKEQYWKTLEMLFNSTSGENFRSAKTLKAKYKGIKRATRKKSAAIRSETYRTGGGPSAAPHLTSIEEKVKEMILLSVDGIKSQFDSDHVDSTRIILQETDKKILKTEDVPVVIELIEAERESIPKHDTINDQPTQNPDSDGEPPPKILIGECATTKNEKWSNWKPKSLRTKKHPALCASGAMKTKRPFERLADAKLELVELQRKILEEEFLNKKKQWAFEEEEKQHKREMWDLEKNLFN